MITRRVARFLVVGGVGFVVDAAILTLALRHLTPSVYAARALSFSVAVLVTWVLNRTFVFATAGTGARAATEYGRYFITQVIAALANLAVFVALIEALPTLADVPVVPLAIGAVLGAAVNYAGSAWWVFRPGARSAP